MCILYYNNFIITNRSKILFLVSLFIITWFQDIWHTKKIKFLQFSKNSIFWLCFSKDLNFLIFTKKIQIFENLKNNFWLGFSKDFNFFFKIPLVDMRTQIFINTCTQILIFFLRDLQTLSKNVTNFIFVKKVYSWKK